MTGNVERADDGQFFRGGGDCNLKIAYLRDEVERLRLARCYFHIRNKQAFFH